MTPYTTLALFLVAMSAVQSAGAQQSQDIPTFDLLRTAHAADSLRHVALRQQGEMTRLLKANTARADTIARQRRELDSLRSARLTRSSAAATPTQGSTPQVALAARGPVASDTLPCEPPVSPAPRPVAPPAVATPTPVAPARLPAMGTPVIGGLFQFWMSAGTAGYRNTYRLRRAELKASGVATPAVSWALMLDLGKSLSATSTALPNGGVQTAVSQSGRALQDAVILIQAKPSLRIDVGQQKIPFGLEGAQSSGTLEMVERALFASDRARGGSFGDVRDLGIAARGSVAGRVDYQVGAFNGSGESQNDVDANEAKAMIGRVVVRPWSSLQLGASGVYSGTSAGDAPRRDRQAVELRFRTKALLIQAEGVAGHDGALARSGEYVHVGYRVRPTLDLHARFDTWDPDTQRESDAATAAERDVIAGATWNLSASGLKAQADVVRRTWSASLAPDRWQLLVNLQTTW